MTGLLFAIVMLGHPAGLQSLPERYSTKVECEAVLQELLKATENDRWEDPKRRVACIRIDRKQT